MIKSGASGFCRSDLPVAILYAISMNVPAEQDAPPTMWVGIVREDYVQCGRIGKGGRLGRG